MRLLCASFALKVAELKAREIKSNQDNYSDEIHVLMATFQTVTALNFVQIT